MTRFKMLCATLVTFTLSSSAFAGEIYGRTGEIYGRTGEIYGLVTTIIGIII